MSEFLELTERDVMLLEALDRLSCSYILPLAYFAGYSDLSYARKRLALLQRYGYIKAQIENKKKIYALAFRGINEIQKTYKAVEWGYTTRHTVGVANVAAWLYCEKNISLYDIQTDRTMGFDKGAQKKNYCYGHQPDIVYDGVAYELEITLKTQKRLIKNIKENGKYRKQVWIVPADKLAIKRNILSCAKKLFMEHSVEVLTYEEILVQLYTQHDIHDNVLRRKSQGDAIEPQSSTASIFDKINSM